MPKTFSVAVVASAALLSWTLAACDRNVPSAATPTPVPEATATPTPTPISTPTPMPTPTPVAVVTPAPAVPVPVVAAPTPMPVPATAVVAPGASPAATTTPSGSGDATPALPVSDAAMLVGELDKPTLIGRRAELTDLKVESLVGDRAFYVLPGGSTRRMLVILDRKLNEGAADAELKILPGQTLNIRGLIEKLPDTEEVASRFGVEGEEADALKGEAIYLHADQVTVTKEP